MKERIPILFTVLAACLLLIACPDAGPASGFPERTVIRQVSVIDVLSGTVLSPQDLIIAEGKILFTTNHYVDTARYKTSYVDGTGKFLMPGLWDMHFHLCWREGNDILLLPALYRNGITGLRDMGGTLAYLKEFRERNRGRLELFGAGPMIDGNPPVQADFSLPLDARSTINQLLDSLRNNGADFFKTYSLLQEPELKAIAAYCTEHNFRFAGHLSEYVEPEVSLSLGQSSVEHLNRLDEIWQTAPRRLDSIGKLMVKLQSYLCPTLITYQLKTRLRDSSVVQAAYAGFIPDELQQEWNRLWSARKSKATKNQDWNRLQDVYHSQLKLVAYLDSLGVPLLAGSDFGGMPYVYPGAGLQEELLLLKAAGLTNAKVIQAATINAARFMNKEQDFGSVTPGKYADLILLDGNPLEDLRNLESVRAVWVKGRKVF